MTCSLCGVLVSNVGLHEDWHAYLNELLFDMGDSQRHGRVPGEVPFCAGRAAVAHPAIPMKHNGDGWECPACGESDTGHLRFHR